MALPLTPLFLGATLLVCLGVLVKRLRSPLASLPGPKLGLLTSWQLKYHELHGNRTRYVHQMHQKYGNVVRVAPNEVVFSSLEAMKEIYLSKGSGFDKTSFYDLFSQFGLKTMFSTLAKGPHSKRRRVIADRYANTNIVRDKSLHGIEERSKNFIKRCTEAPRQELDVYIFLHCYAFDCVTHHLFHPYGSNSILKQSDEEVMREAVFDSSLVRRLFNYYNPTLASLLGKLGFFGKSRDIPRSRNLILNGAAGAEVAEFTLVSRMRDEKFGLGHLDIASECMDHMLAGIETTGGALCFLMWQISQPGYEAIQERLRDEFKANEGMPFEQLPYLEAIVKEGLRVFPSIPMSLPRCVPPEGAEVDGHWLPGGTIVSCQPYSMHRMDETVFPEPDAFKPERWLEEKGSAERNRLFFAFSNGGRACIGRHLAIAEMKTLLRDIYSELKTTPAEGMFCSTIGLKTLTPSQDDGSGFVYCTPRSQRMHSPRHQDPRSTQRDSQPAQNPQLEATIDFTSLTGDLSSKVLTLPFSFNTSGLEAEHDADKTHGYNTVITVSPPREIPPLQSMDQYLFQFYLAETMRLTVPSSYARTEICRFLVPMSIQQPSLLYAVMAFAAVHLGAIGKLPNNSEHLISNLQCTSIQHLRHLLTDQKNPVAKAVALATARTLCQAQIYGGTSSWRVHLNGARAILQSSHFKNQLTYGCACSATDAAFLSSWFNNAEGLAALSPTGLVNGQLEVSCQTSPIVYFDVFGGVMSDLPDLFREVGALVKEARRNKRHDTSQPSILSETDIRLEAERLTREIISKLERDAIENLALRPDLLLTLSMNDICDYALSNAGFLYNALLHIYCGVRELSPSATEVEFCVSQIIRCAEDMTYSAGLSPRVLLVAPLFTAGICATRAAQSSIRSALEDIGKWMRTPHLKKTLAFLERIWSQSTDECVWSEFDETNFDFLPY
ncbi:hypothetical protein NM208_g11442 [Fusarium decemcellulare]|uniref:Uncharacterized protein n=1 Tax=Fusarium decemcellulare TaxID=57161 RepID=A0ACC1RSK9_9HYPO|nr:hypothetical protein NM208_g11442 [Fusarium decemcellulare]